MENSDGNTSTTIKANPKVSVDFLKKFGGELSDEGFGVDVDKQGNIYVSGSFRDSGNFGDDITVVSQASSNAGFVTKLDKTGEVIWVQKLDAASSDEAINIAVDEAGNSYVTGNFKFNLTLNDPTYANNDDGLERVIPESSIDEGNSEDKVQQANIVQLEEDTGEISNPTDTNITINSNGNKDIFVVKLDSNGKAEWATNFGGDSLDYGEGITIDNSGNTYIAGRFKGSASFGSEFSFDSGNSYNGFVAKLNDKGEVEWAKNFDGASNRGYGITVDESGNTFVTGKFADTTNFDNNTSLTSKGGDDVFITKLNDKGEIAWAKNFGSEFSDEGYDVALDKAGNVYLTGFFKRSITFGDTTLKSNGSKDGFVAKLDTAGEVKWAKKFGGTSDDESLGISVDEADNIYLTGSFEDKITFGDTTLTSAGGKDAFIAKLDKMGMVKWAKQLGSSAVDEGFDIAVKGDSETYFTGSFENTATIGDTEIESNGEEDAFLVKLAEEMPEISLAVTPTTISEDGDDTLTYTFTRTGGNTDELTVNFMVAGDAVFNQDYTQTGADSFSATEGMITFDDGETTAAITIDATDDTVIEEDETIKLTVTAAKYDKEEEEEDKETPTDNGDRAILREASAEATKEDEIAPEEVGKLMQSTVRDYKISTASEVMATITNDDTQSNGGSNSGEGENSGGGSNSGEGENSGGGVNTSVATQISNSNKTFTLDGDSAKIKFLLKKSKAGSVNEIALFEVDDEQGMVNGVSPDDSNYAEVASQNATRIFSALGNPPKGLSTDLNRIIELDNGKSFRLLMVKNGTLDGLRNGTVDLSQVLLSNSLEVTDAGENNFDLGFSTDAGDNENIMVQMQLDNQAMKPIGTNLQDEPEGELLDLRGVTGTQTATFTVYREAAYDNYVGWYKVANQNGGIDTDGDGVADVLTTDNGYAAAALNNRVADIDLRVANQGAVEITGEFEGGSIFAPFLIADGTPDDLLDNNAINDPEIYFTYISANSDNKDHARMLGDNIFGFEDLPEGGDGDFNDIVVGAKFA